LKGSDTETRIGSDGIKHSACVGCVISIRYGHAVRSKRNGH